MPECNLPLPCSSTCTSPACASTPAFSIVNSAGIAINANGRTGLSAGVPSDFPQGTAVQGSSILGIGVLGTSAGPQTGTSDTSIGVSGDGFTAGVMGTNSLGGRAGWFQISTPPGRPPNPSTALFAETHGSGAAVEGLVHPDGTGSAGFFHIQNPGSSQVALTVSTIGTGPGINSFGGNAGVVGVSSDTGIVGIGNALGGFFVVGVNVIGTLTATQKNFVIDHPLDPANRYLVHASVESSEMTNVYSGNASLDDNGEAWVELPAWLDALNTDFRYQLTCIGGFAPVYVAEEFSNGRFKIAGGKARMKVSWQLTGIRKDPWALAHPLIVEETKPVDEQGSYRHPEVYDQSEDRAVYRTRYADVLRPVPQGISPHS